MKDKVGRSWGVWYEGVQQADWQSWGIKNERMAEGKADVWFTDSSLCSGAELQKAMKTDKKRDKAKDRWSYIKQKITIDRNKKLKKWSQRKMSQWKCAEKQKEVLIFVFFFDHTYTNL